MRGPAGPTHSLALKLKLMLIFNSMTVPALKTVTMLEFRERAEEIVRSVEKGQRMVLTYRGKAVMRLEPPEPKLDTSDAFYLLSELAETRGESLSNAEIDAIVYAE